MDEEQRLSDVACSAFLRVGWLDQPGDSENKTNIRNDRKKKDRHEKKKRKAKTHRVSRSRMISPLHGSTAASSPFIVRRDHKVRVPVITHTAEQRP